MIDEISIIIPTLNEEMYLPKLLHSLVNQDFNGKLQVIIVDGQSTDQTLEVASTFRKKIKDLLIIETQNRIAHQRNRGVENAKYKYLLFVDADIILTKTFLKKISHKTLKQKDFICAFMLWGSEVDLADYLSYLIFFPFFIPIGIVEKATPGGLMLTTKKVHKRVGGFNEKLVMAEDLDYGERITGMGVKYHFFFNPFALHSPRRLRKMGRINFWLLYLKGYYYIKKYGINSLESKVQYPFGHYNETK